jgi:hypothetical protein
MSDKINKGATSKMRENTIMLEWLAPVAAEYYIYEHMTNTDGIPVTTGTVICTMCDAAIKQPVVGLGVQNIADSDGVRPKPKP